MTHDEAEDIIKPIIDRDEKGRVTHSRWSDGTDWDQEGDDEEEGE